MSPDASAIPAGISTGVPTGITAGKARPCAPRWQLVRTVVVPAVFALVGDRNRWPAAIGRRHTEEAEPLVSDQR